MGNKYKFQGIMNIMNQLKDSQDTRVEQYLNEYDNQGHADSFMAKYNKKFLYLKQVGWLGNLGTHYAEADSQVFLAVTKLLRYRQAMAVDTFEDKQHKDLLKIKTACKISAKKVKDIMTILEKNLETELKIFNNHGNKINCLNGVFNGDTGNFEPRERLTQNYYFTYIIPTNYNPKIKDNALFKKWVNWLGSGVISGGQAASEWIQRAMGYTLSDSQAEETFFYMFGELGRNGKGTLTETIETVLNNVPQWHREALQSSQPLAMPLKWQSLLEKAAGSKPRPDLIGLISSKVVFISEFPNDANLSDSPIKDLTGRQNGEIPLRQLNKGTINYKINCKFWVDSNHAPFIDNDDKVLLSRMSLIEWPLSHKDKRDFDPTNLTHRLKDKAFKTTWVKCKEGREAVLYWLLQGMFKYKNEGLEPLTNMSERLDSIDYDSDYIKQFLTEKGYYVNHSLTGKGYFVNIATFFIEYNNFLTEVGGKPVTKTTLNRRMKVLGADTSSKVKRVKGQRVWANIVKIKEVIGDMVNGQLNYREIIEGESPNMLIDYDTGNFIKFLV